MNRSMAIILGGALVIAIVVAMLVQMKLAPKGKDDKVVAGSEVLVANKTLLTGETLKAENVRWETIPDNLIFKGMVKRKDQADDKKLEIYGRPLRRDIESGEAVTTQALVPVSGTGNFLAASLSPGMRAMAVSIKAETAAGGFVTPGDYVDVLMTYQLTLKGDASDYSSQAIQRYASETILSNVRVLAVDQNSKEAAREAKVGKTVTVEVTKEQAQILAMASTMGSITVALRRLGEKDTAADKNAPLTTDVTTSRVIRAVYGIMNKSKTTSNTVRVYSGSAVDNVPVRATPGR